MLSEADFLDTLLVLGFPPELKDLLKEVRCIVTISLQFLLTNDFSCILHTEKKLEAFCLSYFLTLSTTQICHGG